MHPGTLASRNFPLEEHFPSEDCTLGTLPLLKSGVGTINFRTVLQYRQSTRQMHLFMSSMNAITALWG